ncbi:cellobiose transport system permease protein [Amycolatopsis sulphurea]|uniref:Cellobiose transport system permease protein n=1 Tax=Amycolatopsis sulphurea TaxID=76022 RepID=A0A2A9FDE0_9PSEU|nr:carbohydrate ABC transporter permease [Amycolatopsis sulphurea]PFG49374.1 cellobiose transport system permease protein [Amycolatopsis sulphurea]
MRPRRRAGAWVYVVLAGVLAGSIFPLYWSFAVSSRDNSAIGETSPLLLPGGHFFENVQRVFDTVDFWQAIGNSLIVASTVMVSNVVLSTVAGYAFARLRFPGRNSLFLLVAGSAMVPAQLGVIPLFLVINDLGWYGRLEAVIVPGLVSAFGVFWMRQACEGAVSADLIDAATVDGASVLRTFWHVAVPALRPHAAVLAMITFLGAWNDYFWPLAVLDSSDSPTVQVVLSQLASGYYTDYALMLTGATLGVLPVIVLFLLLGRYLVRSIAGGVRYG